MLGGLEHFGTEASMDSLFLLVCGVTTVVWGIGIKDKCESMGEYLKHIEESGLDASPGKWESAYRAHESDTRSTGNFVIVVGILFVLAAFFNI